jgi:hypothetical protein
MLTASSSAAPPTLDLLLARADDCDPVLPPLPLHRFDEGADPGAQMAAAPRPRGDRGDIGASEMNPNSLADQRWGLVVPDGREGEQLRGALAALVRHRQAQLREPLRIFTVPRELPAADIERWVRDAYQSPDVEEEERPGYLLLAGDFTQIPLPLQLSLAGGTEAFVGRIALPALADYEAYADKLVRSEKQAARAQAHGLFFSARDRSAAISLGDSGLVQPCLQGLCRKQQAGRLAATLQTIDSLDEAPLLRAARAAPPALLFTLSHGLGAPTGGWPSVQAQREQQGALLCARHPREVLTAHEAAAGAFLSDGIWMMFACFGAGTPQHSAFAPWLSELARQQLADPVESVLRSLPPGGAPGFVATLPQAALANPAGPLAVIGHVDLAWNFSFTEPGSERPDRHARFGEAARMLLSGSRAGVALRKLHKDIARLSGALLDPWAELADPAREALRRAYLRLQREDLRQFILLGDPAARLPITGSVPI